MLVYPGSDGTAWESLRLNALREAMEDMRMISLCEAERGRDFTESLLTRIAGAPVTFRVLPPASFYPALRDAVAEALGEKV